MTVAVITPCYQSNVEWLAKAHRSIVQQDYPCHHIIVADGPQDLPIDGFSGSKIVLPRSYADYGNTPRVLGCTHAMGSIPNLEAIAFLDDDNWYMPGHIRSLMDATAQSGADIGASGRNLHRMDGEFLMPCYQVDGVKVVDTNCMLVRKSAFDTLIAWALCPYELAGTGDLVYWRFVQERGKKTVFTGEPTLAYRSRHVLHYEAAGVAPPPGAVLRTNQAGDSYDRTPENSGA